MYFVYPNISLKDTFILVNTIFIIRDLFSILCKLNYKFMPGYLLIFMYKDTNEYQQKLIRQDHGSN